MQPLPAYKSYKSLTEAGDVLADSEMGWYLRLDTWIALAKWMYERDATPGEAYRESGLVQRIPD